MERTDSDALVIFGATGDLCFKKIYPALYNLVRRGHLSVPVIGVARAGWNLDKLADHVRDSVHTAVKNADESVLSKLTALLKYVDGDYTKRETYDSLKKALGDASDDRRVSSARQHGEDDHEDHGGAKLSKHDEFPQARPMAAISKSISLIPANGAITPPTP